MKQRILWSAASAVMLAGLFAAPSAGAQNAIERKGGSCPSGYSQSASYCVKN